MKISELMEADPYKGMKNVKGTVYLMHLDRPFHHAQHYIGWTNDVDKREIEHKAGRGSPYLRAAKAAGIDFHIVRTWPNEDRHFERKLKNRKKAREICPVCRAEKAARLSVHNNMPVHESSMAPLYHTTTIAKLTKILFDNTLLGNTVHDINPEQRDIKGISTTRSLQFAKQWGGNFYKTTYAILVLDQQKIANNFKIVPIDFYTTTAQTAPFTPDSEKVKFKNFRRTAERAEAEEFIITPALGNLDKYLIEILIPKASYDSLIEFRDYQLEQLEINPEDESAIYDLNEIEDILQHPKLKVI